MWVQLSRTEIFIFLVSLGEMMKTAEKKSRDGCITLVRARAEGLMPMQQFFLQISRCDQNIRGKNEDDDRDENKDNDQDDEYDGQDGQGECLTVASSSFKSLFIQCANLH